MVGGEAAGYVAHAAPQQVRIPQSSADWLWEQDVNHYPEWSYTMFNKKTLLALLISAAAANASTAGPATASGAPHAARRRERLCAAKSHSGRP